MRCPKCRYLIHTDPAACPNCGFVLSSSSDRAAEIDVATAKGPEGPLADLPLGAAAAPDRRPAAGKLPLPFPSTAARKPSSPPAPRPPLSVRRKTPEAPRLRAPSARAGAAEAAVRFDLEAVRPHEAEPDIRPGSRGRTSVAASLGARTVAAAIDAAVLGGIAVVVVHFTLRLADVAAFEWGAVPVAPLSVFLLLLTFGYHSGLTGAGGQTIGKMAMGIRVVRADGTPLSWTAAALRPPAALLSVLPFGLGFLAGWLRPDRATLHDRICGTRVVR